MNKEHKNILSGVSKYALGAALMVLPLQVCAWDFTPDSTRYLSDPAYLPLQGQVYGVTTWTFGETNGENYNLNTGVQKNNYTDNNNTFTQTLAYGLTDDIEFRLSESYDYDHDKTTNLAGNGTGTTTEGFTDPTIGATWRALDEKKFPVNVDLIATYQPNWVNAESATEASSGTAGRGGQEAAIGAATSYEMRDFTVYGEFLATYLGDRNTLNQDTGVDTSTQNSWQYLLNLQTQTRLNDWLSLNLGVEEQLSQGDDASYVNTGGNLVSYSDSSHNVTMFTAATNFQIIPNRLVTGITYQFNYYGDHVSEYSPGFTANNNQVKDEYDNIFGLNLRYVFF